MTQTKTENPLADITIPSAKSSKDSAVSVTDLLDIHDWLKEHNRLCRCGKLVSHTNTWGAFYCKNCVPVTMPEPGERIIKVTPNAVERCLYRALRSGLKQLNQATKERKDPKPVADEQSIKPTQGFRSIDLDKVSLPNWTWDYGRLQGPVASTRAKDCGATVCRW